MNVLSLSLIVRLLTNIYPARDVHPTWFWFLFNGWLSASLPLFLPYAIVYFLCHMFNPRFLTMLHLYTIMQVAEAEQKTAGGLLLTEASKEKPSIGEVRGSKL